MAVMTMDDECDDGSGGGGRGGDGGGGGRDISISWDSILQSKKSLQGRI